MTNENRAIAEAAARLAKADLRVQLQRVSGDEAHRILPVIWPHIQDLLAMVDASGRIAEMFNSIEHLEYQDYDSSGLPVHLCQRFSEMPQFASASANIKYIVQRLGYANVIGIFLAKTERNWLIKVPSVGPKKGGEFSAWVKEVFVANQIKWTESEVAQFTPYANLTILLHWVTGRDSFSWLGQPSGVGLTKEPLIMSDYDQLIKMGIKTTADLAQTSVYVLAKAFSDDEFAMKRFSSFLSKRGLSFGMRFRPEWR